jgi:hypothetical protein
MFICFTVEYDEEGGGPIKIKIEMPSIDGFLAAQDQGSFQFIAPCTFYGSPFRQEVLFASVRQTNVEGNFHSNLKISALFPAGQSG